MRGKLPAALASSRRELRRIHVSLAARSMQYRSLLTEVGRAVFTLASADSTRMAHLAGFPVPWRLMQTRNADQGDAAGESGRWLLTAVVIRSQPRQRSETG